MFNVVNNLEHKDQRIKFESRSKGYLNALQTNLNSNIEALRSIEDFFYNSDYVSRKEFSGFVNGLLSRHPSIQAFGWNPLVQDNEREEFERLAQNEGFGNFQFTERSEEKKLVRAGQRQEYVVVYYIDPLETNKPALGFDISSDQTRLQAINRGFNTGKLTVTEKITLVQEIGNQSGVLLLLPMYQQSIHSKTPVGRHQNRKGFLVEVLRIGDVVENTLKDFPDEGIDLYLYDMSAEKEEHRLLYSQPREVSPKTDSPMKKEVHQGELSWRESFDFAGRQWEVLFRPSSSYDYSHKVWHAWVVLCAGLFCTFLLTFYLLKKLNYTKEIEQRVKQQVRTNQQLEKEIADRKQAEEALQKNRDELERRVNKRTQEILEIHKQLLHSEKLSAIGRLSASIAHEFNNPLYGIQSVLEGIAKNISLDEEYQKLTSLALSECDRVKDLIMNLQDFSNPSPGVKKETDIHTLLEDMLVMVDKEYKKAKITVRKDYAADLPRIQIIPDQIKQVLLNLLTNAREAIGGRYGAVVTCTTENLVSEIAVRISDTGCGIPEDILPHIFEPFFTTKQAPKGTGLGLSVSYGIIREHGGNIVVKSHPGQGSTFSILLPFTGEDR